MLNIKGPAGQQICQVPVEKEADAAFIVQACNSHEALVEAAHEAARQIEYLHEKLGFETGTGNAVLAKLHTALSLAGAKP